MPASRAVQVVVGVALVAGAVAGGWYLLVVAPANTEPVALVAVPPANFDPTGGRTRPLPPDPMVLTLDVLPQLQPGMSRAEVEDVIGLPPAERVEPIAGGGGRVTYRTAYPIDLTGRGGRLPAGAWPLSCVAFEFDATLPGHPLVNVHYPDPLF